MRRNNLTGRLPSARPTGKPGEPGSKPSASARRRGVHQDDQQRMAKIAARTRVVMKEFLTRATERKIDRLSDLITESFRYLSRKQTMVERIHIDPSSFAITLYSEAGQRFPRNGCRRVRSRSSRFRCSGDWRERRPIRCRRSLIRRWPGSTRPIGGIWSSVISPREPPGLDSLDRHGSRSALLPGAPAAHRPGLPPQIR